MVSYRVKTCFLSACILLVVGRAWISNGRLAVYDQYGVRVPEEIYRMAERPILDRVGKTYFNKHVRLKAVFVEPRDYPKLRKYHFWWRVVFEDDDPSVIVSINITVTAVKKVLVEYLKLPDCVKYPEHCLDGINREEALTIAIKNGLDSREGMWDWVFCYDDRYDQFTWKFMNNLWEIRISAATGEVLAKGRIYSWKLIPLD